MGDLGTLDETKPEDTAPAEPHTDIQTTNSAILNSLGPRHSDEGYDMHAYGDSSSRPTDPLKGMIYFNVETNTIEYYDGASWVELGFMGSALTYLDPPVNVLYDDFNSDGDQSTSWTDLDLSGNVPTGALAVFIEAYIYNHPEWDPLVEKNRLWFREKGKAQDTDDYYCALKEGGTTVWGMTPKWSDKGQFIVPCDDNRVIEYKTRYKTDLTELSVNLMGYYG